MADMFLASRTTELKARPNNKKTSDDIKSVHQLSPTTSPSSDIDPTLKPPSLTTTSIQFATVLLAVMFYLLRAYKIQLMEFEVDLVYGIIPIECILLTIVLFGLGMREIVMTFAYLQRPSHIGVEKNGYMKS